MYNEKTKDMLVKGKWFTPADALSDHLDMIQHGKNMWNFPLHNCYIPVRHTILKKPSMVDVYSDDLGYHFGKTGQNATYDGLDLHPFKPNNPLKGYRMSSPPKERSGWEIHYAQGKPFRKAIHFNRFSKPKTQYGRERAHVENQSEDDFVASLADHVPLDVVSEGDQEAEVKKSRQFWCLFALFKINL